MDVIIKRKFVDLGVLQIGDIFYYPDDDSYYMFTNAFTATSSGRNNSIYINLKKGTYKTFNSYDERVVLIKNFKLVIEQDF